MLISRSGHQGPSIDFSLVPDAPGSYQFLSATGRVLYVGKARSLRSRLRSYFPPDKHSPKTLQLINEAHSLDWVQVSTNAEAVLVEYSLIKHNRPKYNVALRDDKSYPYLAISKKDDWPRPVVTRSSHRRDTQYFGPYTNVGAVRETLDVLIKAFPLRTCSDTKLDRHNKLGKPCLLYHIDRCSGPCIGAITQDEYAKLVKKVTEFLQGKDTDLIWELESQMLQASENLNFEKAARLRDALASAREVVARQHVTTKTKVDFDVLGLWRNEIEAQIEVLHVRRGSIVGTWGFLLEANPQTPSGDLMATALGVLFEQSVSTAPEQIILGELPSEIEMYEELFSSRTNRSVSITVPKLEYKRKLLELATINAKANLDRNFLRFTRNHNSRTIALNHLREELGMLRAPLRIECYDMSHIQGRDYVGSMVVMEDGILKKAHYRHFRVKTISGNDDYGAMREVLTRRVSRLSEPANGQDGSFGNMPDLLVVDGGKGQLKVAQEVIEESGLSGKFYLCSLAKRNEEVYIPGRSAPVILDRSSGALHLLQNVRDEAHRFAITYHRKLRDTRMVSGVLDNLPGLGEKRRRRLLDEYGSIRELQELSREVLLAISWLPDSVGQAVFDRLHPDSSKSG